MRDALTVLKRIRKHRKQGAEHSFMEAERAREAQQERVDVIANNLANMNTTGYQRRRAAFNDLIYEDNKRPNNRHSRADGLVPGGVKAGLGVRMAAAYRVVEQGNLAQTGNPYDLAIQGTGYIPVTLANGETAYTRDGTFQLNENGQVVTHDGYLLEPAITVPEDAIDVTVNASGEVLVKIEGQVEFSNVGQIQTANFQNEPGLESIGNNLYKETPASGNATVGNPGTEGYGTILQGFLETSNVNAVEEISNLISAQRAYEMNSKVIQTSDEMLGTLTSLR